jgi:hypothetical protein
MRTRTIGLKALLLAAAAATVAAPQASAGEAQDRIFALGVLDEVATGERLVYGHRRAGSVADAGAVPPIVDGEVTIALTDSEATDGRDAEVTLRSGEQTRALTSFPAAAGNPLLMLFMENSVRAMAAATGGSPHYIRNRMREALRTQDQGAPAEIQVGGETVQGRRYSFRPFADDPNAARMGAFAELEISFVVSDAVPGRYAVLDLATGPGPEGAPALRETITYQSVEKSG